MLDISRESSVNELPLRRPKGPKNVVFRPITLSSMYFISFEISAFFPSPLYVDRCLPFLVEQISDEQILRLEHFFKGIILILRLIYTLQIRKFNLKK